MEELQVYDETIEVCDNDTIEAQFSDEVMKDTIREYERYQSGEITKTEYSYFLISVMDNYFKLKANKKRRDITGSYHVDAEDLEHDFVVTILENIDSYDPYRAHPIAYFNSRLNNKAVSVLGPEVKDHHKNQVIRLNKIARKYGFKEGLSDPRLTPDTLAIISGESIAICENAWELNRQRAISLEDAAENGIEPSIGDNPESIYIHNESSEIVLDKLSKFNPFQLFMIKHAVMADDKADNGGKLPTRRFLFSNFLILDVSISFISSRFIRKHSRHAVSPGITTCPTSDWWRL